MNRAEGAGRTITTTTENQKKQKRKTLTFIIGVPEGEGLKESSKK